MHPFSSDLTHTRANAQTPRDDPHRPRLRPTESHERGESHGPWIEVALPSDDSAPRRARAAVRAAGRGLGGDTVEIATLMTSELVTNAVVHPPERVGGVVELRIAGDDLRLRVEVGDAGPGFDPVNPRWRPLERGGGRGLQLVDQLSGRWGVGRRGDRFVVWFELCRGG